MRALTEKQAAILGFVSQWLEEQGYPPSVREVAKHFQINVPSAAQHLKALEHKGVLTRAPGRSRSLVIKKLPLESRWGEAAAPRPALAAGAASTASAPHSAAGAPVRAAASAAGGRAFPAEAPGFRLIGDIAAGAPLLIEESNDAEMLAPTPSWFGRGEHVALRVRGDSMAGDAINDGDFAIVRLTRDVPAHEIAAVRTLEGEVTLKRVRLVGAEAQLLSSNPEHPVRLFPADQVEVVGILAGIIRRS